MTRKGVILFFNLLLLLPYISQAQKKEFRGRVLDERTNQPLEFVSIYMTNTTFGTQTDAKGAFSIMLEPGKFEVVVSMVGYGAIVHPILISDGTAPVTPVLFKLTESEEALKAVSVKARRDSSWYENLEVFKQHFLGRSEVARQCKLMNPEVLIIVFNERNRTLKVSANEPLIIENPALGYTISYLLVDFLFDMEQNYISTLGYPGCSRLKGGKVKHKRWARNRVKAYNGSSMHFVRALRKQTLEEEGFNLRRLVRKPNPQRPTEQQLEEARMQLRIRGGNAGLAADHPLNVTLSKTRLPKVIEELDTARVPYVDYILAEKDQVLLAFDGYFQVVYAREKEELAYVASVSMFQKRQPTYQTSVIFLKDKYVVLEKSGSVTHPLGILFEGYWGWEKVGDMLPLDYLSD